MKIKYVLDSGAFVPEKAHSLDAGFDLRLPAKEAINVDSVTVPAGGAVVINTGVHLAIPEGYVGMLKSKSGLNVKHGLRCEGVIDSGYTGAIVAKIYNDSDQSYVFRPGEKLTQIVILPIPDVELKRTAALDNTERMMDGFGSTGK